MVGTPTPSMAYPSSPRTEMHFNDQYPYIPQPYGHQPPAPQPSIHPVERRPPHERPVPRRHPTSNSGAWVTSDDLMYDIERLLNVGGQQSTAQT